MRLLRAIILLALVGPAHAGASAGELGLGANEVLTYHVSWVLLPGVGSIEIVANAATDGITGAPCLRVVTTTSTVGLAHLLLPFEARSESLFDTDSGRLLSLEESSVTRKGRNTHSVTFDYAAGVARYTTPGPAAAATRRLAMPSGYPTDLITCLVNARTWNLSPGQARDALVLFNDEFYQLTVHAIDYERLVTPLGAFNTVTLEPRMEKTPPKGMFKRGSRVRVWISRDSRRLPVRFQVVFRFGTGIATLVEYSPPSQPERYRGLNLP
jgi:hypothetical protein